MTETLPEIFDESTANKPLQQVKQQKVISLKRQRLDESAAVPTKAKKRTKPEQKAGRAKAKAGPLLDWSIFTNKAKVVTPRVEETSRPATQATKFDWSSFPADLVEWLQAETQLVSPNKGSLALMVMTKTWTQVAGGLKCSKCNDDNGQWSQAFAGRGVTWQISCKKCKAVATLASLFDTQGKTLAKSIWDKAEEAKLDKGAILAMCANSFREEHAKQSPLINNAKAAIPTPMAMEEPSCPFSADGSLGDRHVGLVESPDTDSATAALTDTGPPAALALTNDVSSIHEERPPPAHSASEEISSPLPTALADDTLLTDAGSASEEHEHEETALLASVATKSQEIENALRQEIHAMKAILVQKDAIIAEKDKLIAAMQTEKARSTSKGAKSSMSRGPIAGVAKLMGKTTSKGPRCNNTPATGANAIACKVNPKMTFAEAAKQGVIMPLPYTGLNKPRDIKVAPQQTVTAMFHQKTRSRGVRKPSLEVVFLSGVKKASYSALRTEMRQLGIRTKKVTMMCWQGTVLMVVVASSETQNLKQKTSQMNGKVIEDWEWGNDKHIPKYLRKDMTEAQGRLWLAKKQLDALMTIHVKARGETLTVVQQLIAKVAQCAENAELYISNHQKEDKDGFTKVKPKNSFTILKKQSHQNSRECDAVANPSNLC